MIIEPKVRGFICTTSHPEGCKENVRKQITYIKNLPKCNGPKKVLVIGASTGYGLASRIASTYGCDAATVGVIFDKPASGSVLPQQAGIIPLHLKSLPQKTATMQKPLTGMPFLPKSKTDH